MPALLVALAQQLSTMFGVGLVFLVLTTSPSTPTTTTAVPPPSSTGFVKVSGQKFVLNGETYPLVGYAFRILVISAVQHDSQYTHSANLYWVGLMGYSTAQMNQAFSDIAATGATTVRTW